MLSSTNKFNTLSFDLINKIKSIANKGVPFSKGDLLFKEGDHKEFIYLIEKGGVSLVKNNTESKEKIEILSQKDGDLVGIDLIFNDENCEYSALVVEPSILYKVLIADFKDMLSKNNSSSMELLRYLSSLLNQLDKKK